MNLPLTVVLLVASVALTVFFGWLGAKPRDYSKLSRPPWQFLMLISAAMVLIAFVGILNELGVSTGSR